MRRYLSPEEQLEAEIQAADALPASLAAIGLLTGVRSPLLARAGQMTLSLYLLHAFLAGNARFELCAALSMLHYAAPERLRALLPNYRPAGNDHGLVLVHNGGTDDAGNEPEIRRETVVESVDDVPQESAARRASSRVCSGRRARGTYG